MLERQQNTTFSSVLRGDAEERGNCDSVLNLKYFIQALKFRWPLRS